MTSTKEGNRILLKVSGESLRGEGTSVIDPNIVASLAHEVSLLCSTHFKQVVIVVGAGNIWRGAEHPEMDEAQAHYAGMMATIVNALAIQGALSALDQESRVLSAINADTVCEPYIRLRAIRHLEKGRVVICAGGTGNPFFTTDTAAVLRAVELDCDQLYMGKNGVSGVFDADPRVNPEAEHIPALSHMHVIEQGLAVMDFTALTLAMDNHLPIIVFNGNKPGEIQRIMEQRTLYTIIAS